MRKLLIFLLLLSMAAAHGQQSNSLSFPLPISKKRVALFGIGSISAEDLKNINGSGKFSGAITLNDTGKNVKVTAFLSGNRNASNGDTTLASTLLYPEVGKASCIATLNSMWKIRNSESQFIGGFVQGSFKSINGKRTFQATGKDTSALFTILDWSAGIRYVKAQDIGTARTFLSASAFVNLYNIPDEDNEDYRLIFNEPKMPSAFWAFGCKLTYEVNGAQFFADFRHVFGSETKIPSRDLRGFNINVGFIFNVNIIEL